MNYHYWHLKKKMTRHVEGNFERKSADLQNPSSVRDSTSIFLNNL